MAVRLGLIRAHLAHEKLRYTIIIYEYAKTYGAPCIPVHGSFLASCPRERYKNVPVSNVRMQDKCIKYNPQVARAAAKEE
jgi:hypothetical protein